MKNTETAYIGLGSNEGERILALSEAVRKIRELPGIVLLAMSQLYETVPIGVAGGPFINAVIMIETGMGPRRLLGSLLVIEAGMGRTRSGPAPAPRNIDLDLLLYGDRVIREKGLVVPHPRMAERRFVLEPLSEIAPDLRMPLTGETAAKAAGVLKNRCPEQRVTRIGNLKAFPPRSQAAKGATFPP